MSKHVIFFSAIGFLVLVLVGFMFIQERIIYTGTEVILETRPIDPRDLFRGEYVILRYEIENDTLVQEAISRDDRLVDGSTLYLRLSVDGRNIATVAEVSKTKPDFSKDLWIRGQVENRMVRFPNLEQYFVPEGSGTPIERLGRGVYVKARLLDGEARVYGLLDKDLNDIDPYEYRE
jgi:uncharacterized membrane-anchored protein